MWRSAREEDHPAVLAAVGRWWDDDRGAELGSLLPRLFFQHFGSTSVVVHEDDTLVAFLVGFPSPSHDDHAYVHFVGIDPARRGTGLGRALYEWFFDLVRDHGRTTVHAVTGVSNTRSQDFHRHLGFSLSGPLRDYDGPGLDRIAMTTVLSGG